MVQRQQEEGAVHEVGGIDEEHVTSAGTGRVEGRLEFRGEEFLLGRDVLGQRLLGGTGTGTARVRCQVNPSPARKVGTCGAAADPGQFAAIASTASAVVGGRGVR